MDKLRMESPDMAAQNIDCIAALFPNCVTEASDGHGGIKRAINFELLKQMLSPDVVDGDERYEFTWVGKKAAIVEANKPIRKTLRPCPEESKDWTPPKISTSRATIWKSLSCCRELSRQGEDDIHRPAVQHRQRLHLRRRFYALAGRRKRADGNV